MASHACISLLSSPPGNWRFGLQASRVSPVLTPPVEDRHILPQECIPVNTILCYVKQKRNATKSYVVGLDKGGSVVFVFSGFVVFSGKQNPNVEPLPSVLLNKIAPPEAIITFLAIKTKPVPSGRAVRALPAR